MYIFKCVCVCAFFPLKLLSNLHSSGGNYWLTLSLHLVSQFARHLLGEMVIHCSFAHQLAQPRISEDNSMKNRNHFVLLARRMKLMAVCV